MTKIEYLDETWNPIQDKIKGKMGKGYHCTKISKGCQNCWAESMNKRFGNGLPFDDRPCEYEINYKELYKPMNWKKKRVIGVQFMGDLFHENINDDQILRLIKIMFNTEHIYVVLTKRPIIMREFFNNWICPYNCYCGISISNQEEFNYKIADLIQTRCKHRFISIEPMLGPIDLSYFILENINECEFDSDPSSKKTWYNGIEWVIVGGETGVRGRYLNPKWANGVKDQCIEYDIPFFFKQWGNLPSFIKGLGRKINGRYLDGREWNQVPW